MPYDIIIGRNISDKKILESKGLTFIGKGYVKMGQYTSLSNKIFMDIARSHVILVAGKRGSGKSYTLGVIAEELSNLPKEANQNIASLIFDTMGIYWTMKFQISKINKRTDDSRMFKFKIKIGQIRLRGIKSKSQFIKKLSFLHPDNFYLNPGFFFEGFGDGIHEMNFHRLMHPMAP